MTPYTASKIRRLDLIEPECQLTQRRLQRTSHLLEYMGCGPEITHDSNCKRERVRYGVATPCRGTDEYGYLDCVNIKWPKWVTDKLILKAYDLVDEAFSARGRYERSRARKAREAL